MPGAPGQILPAGRLISAWKRIERARVTVVLREDAQEPEVDWKNVVNLIQRGDRGREVLYQLCTRRAGSWQRRLGTQDVDDRVHDVFLIVARRYAGVTCSIRNVSWALCARCCTPV